MSHLISITGAGPGDPDLLTVKALRRIRQADVILYDALHGEEILKLAPEGSLKIYAGKHYQDGQYQSQRQELINSQLKQYALEGKKVVRLKAGDPFIFGRGAEELAYCLAAKLNVEVIPGISAGPAAAASFRIPLTLRERNSMTLFYTGHKRNEGFDHLHAVAAVLKTHAPVMIYMGLKNLVPLCLELLEQDVPESLPVQIVSCVGHPGQQIFSTTLGSVPVDPSCSLLPLPAVIVMGTYATPVLD